MNFELGKEYIVKVSERGIVPTEEFDRGRWYDKDSDDLDFLTDEEKIVVINGVLNKIRAEIIQMPTISLNANDIYKADVLAIINKYRTESEEV